MNASRLPRVNSLIRNLLTRSSPASDALMEDLISGLQGAVFADAYAILRLDPGNGLARILAQRGLRLPEGKSSRMVKATAVTKLLSGCDSGQACSSGGPFDEPFLGEEGAADLLAACRDFGSERLVTIALRRRAEKFTAREKERFLIISGVINLMISCSYDTLDMGRPRDVDPLTGLGLYQVFHDTLDKEISRSRRRSGRITVSILAVLGKEGLLEGQSMPDDSAIVLVAETLVSQLRNFDTVIRYSSGEFALILPDIGGGVAEKVINRLLESIRSSNGKSGIRVCAGFSCYPEDGSTAERLIETAEAASNQAVRESNTAVMRWEGD